MMLVHAALGFISILVIFRFLVEEEGERQYDGFPFRRTLTGTLRAIKFLSGKSSPSGPACVANGSAVDFRLPENEGLISGTMPI